MKRNILFALCAVCVLLFLAFSASAEGVTINSANFPDPHFRAYVTEKFDTNQKGYLTADEINSVKQIIVLNMGISSLKGIELFPNLEELFCSGNALTQLDLRGNTCLTGLYCKDNQITSLNVSMLPELRKLQVQNNSLTKLDLLNNTLLYNLYCEDNYLTSLDITTTKVCADYSQWCDMGHQKTGGMMYVIMTKAQQAVYEEKFAGSSWNSRLTVRLQDDRFGQRSLVNYIYDSFDTDRDYLLSDSELAAVTRIDVSGMGINFFNGLRYFKNLTELICINNNLTKLDLTSNTRLTILRASGNRISSLDVSYLTELKQLSVNDNQLTSLDLRANTKLHGLYCDHNALTNLELTGTRLFDGNSIDWGDFGCQSGGTITVNMTAEQKAVFEDRYASRPDNADVTVNVVDGRFPDPVFRQYVYDNFDRLHDGTLSNSDILGVTHIYANGKQIVSLKGIELFPNLEMLNCWNNHLNELDVSHNTALTELHCSYNRLTGLDVSQNTLLTLLSCENNALTELDLSRSSELKDLYCNDNFITELDIAGTKVCTSASNYVYLGKSRNSDTVIVSMSAAQKSVFDAGFASNASNAGVTVKVVDGRFRDPVFRGYVCDHFDTDHDGTLSDSELADVTDIYVSSTGIFSLEGIDLFPNLSILMCNDNELTELDISRNTQLEQLNCSANRLKTLDVSVNQALQTLFCSGNQLSKLNVAYNPDLKMLDCGNNGLTALAVGSNSDLVYLDCSNNRISTLDLLRNTDLTYLYCSNNRIIGLDFSGNRLLTELSCEGNDIYRMDISGTQVLSSNSAVGYLGKRMVGDVISTVYVSMTAAQKSVYDAYFADDPRNVRVSVKLVDGRFTDHLFRKYVYDEFDTDGDDALSDGELAAVTRINVQEKGIVTLGGIELFPNLTELICCINDLTELDLSRNTRLTYLDCSINDLPELDLSGNTALTELNCSSNDLTEIDVSKNTALTTLSCSDNALTALDLSSNTALDKLNCSSNQLTEINVSRNTVLTTLFCDSNDISSLETGNCPALFYLSCGVNALEELDLKSNTQLKYLACTGNQLTALDLSRNAALIYLDCSGNFMTALDLTVNAEMDFENCFIGSQMDNITITASLTDEQAVRFREEAYRFSLKNERVEIRTISEKALHTPEALTVIGEEAFAGTAFKTVHLSEGVTSIEKNAFKDCAALEFIYIPGTVTSIASDAFSGCSGFTIVGSAGSAAEAYAHAHGIAFLSQET